MNKNKKTIIIIIVIMIISLTAFILANIIKPNKKEENKKPEEVEQLPSDSEKLDKNQKYVIENVKKFNEYITDPTKTSQDFAELTGQSKNYFMPMVGMNSIEGYGLPNDYKKQIKEDLSEYEKKHQNYINNLAKEVKSNYKYELVDKPLYTEDKKQLMQQLKVTPYKYILYQRDLASVQDYLLNLTNKTDLEENIETMVFMYKLKIKAMELLDGQLSDYKNDKSYDVNIVYDIDKEIKCSTCMFYVNYAYGEYTDEVKPTTTGGSAYETLKEQRVQKIIETAINNNKLDKENPLKLS